MSMKKRGSLQTKSTEVEGSVGIDDGELQKRALKKARKIQVPEAAAILGQQEEEGADGTSSECIYGVSGSGGDGVSGEEAGDDVASGGSDELDREPREEGGRAASGGSDALDREPREEAASINDGENDQGPAHNRPILRTSFAGYFARESAKSQANKEVVTGKSGSSSDEDASENEETEPGLMARRRRTKEEEISDESSGSSSDGESDEEEEEESDDTEKKPNDSTAFGRAFRKIMKKKLPSTALTEAMGPMLSSHKLLVTKKLEEAAEGRKVKSESKKEKQALREKGHTVPTIYAAAKDKELMKLATRGVVKLFNAVSKAQCVQEAAKVSKDSEVKEVAKRSKSTFLAMLQGGNGAVSHSLNMQRQPSDSKKEVVAEGQPGWSALRETFMLGKSKLKDWDKKGDEPMDEQGAESSGEDSGSE